MTRQEIIKKLEEVAEEVAWGNNDELTDHARKLAYVAICSAIDFIKANKEYKND